MIITEKDRHIMYILYIKLNYYMFLNYFINLNRIEN